MLHTLFLLICLKDAPQACEPRELILDGLATHPGAAFVQAQAQVAKWIEGHPGYSVKRWRLRPGQGV